MNSPQHRVSSADRDNPGAAASLLTVVLPLKGRHLFTLRFLWHANRARLPYRILIADGQVHPVLAPMLDDCAKLFPALDVEYVRYPDDADFACYFAKMAGALDRVRTPYVVLADNDDFLARAGIDRSVEFLESNPDYVCCGGGIAGFSVYSPMSDPLGGVIGPLNKLSYRYMPYDRSVDFGSDSMTERLVTGLRNSWSYYAVFRTPALATIWREVVELDLSDLQLHEKFCAMRTLTLGKAKSDPSIIGYLRQYQTSMRSAFTVDWVQHLLRNRFSTDFANIVGRISAHAAEGDKGDPSVIAELLRQRVEPWLRDFIRLNYGLSGTVRQYIRERAPGLLMWLKKRRRFSVGRERKTMFARLRDDRATPDYLKSFRQELAGIEETIDGREFRQFLAPFVTDLQLEARAI